MWAPGVSSLFSFPYKWLMNFEGVVSFLISFFITLIYDLSFIQPNNQKCCANSRSMSSITWMLE